MMILLTNRLGLGQALDPRILSFLKKTDILFEPYDALDLLEILTLRVEKALDTEKVDPVALRKVAALASRETGDARKAVEPFSESSHRRRGNHWPADRNRGRYCRTEIGDRQNVALIRALAVQQKLALQACYRSLSKGFRRVFHWPDL